MERDTRDGLQVMHQSEQAHVMTPTPTPTKTKRDGRSSSTARLRLVKAAIRVHAHGGRRLHRVLFVAAVPDHFENARKRDHEPEHGDDARETDETTSHQSRLSTEGISRKSFGTSLRARSLGHRSLDHRPARSVLPAVRAR
jgi:hypothetical protein